VASSARAAGVDLEDLPEELSRRFQGELEALDHRVAEDLVIDALGLGLPQQDERVVQRLDATGVMGGVQAHGVPSP